MKYRDHYNGSNDYPDDAMDGSDRGGGAFELSGLRRLDRRSMDDHSSSSLHNAAMLRDVALREEDDEDDVENDEDENDLAAAAEEDEEDEDEDDENFGGAASLPHPEELKADRSSQDATGTSQRRGGRRRRHRRCFGISVFAGALAFLVILLVVVAPLRHHTTNRPQQQNTNQTSAVPRTATFDQVVAFLQSSAVSNETALRDTDSPHHQAARWIAERDPMNWAVPLLVQDKNTTNNNNGRTLTTTTTTSKEEERRKPSYHYKFIVRYVMALNFFALRLPDQWQTDLNFLSGRSVCEWHGSIVHQSGFVVVGIACNYDDLGPPTELRLGHPGFNGTIPTENGLLTTLIEFDLQGASLKGTIPTELGNLYQLTVLDLSDNDLNGAIPTSIGNLTALQRLYVNDNLLNGPIPTELALLTSLQVLVLENNRLSGDPLSTWNGLALKRLYAGNNRFSGVLDHTFMPNGSHLADLDLSNNLFTVRNHELPAHFFAMRSLLTLDLSDNPLRGHVSPGVILPTHNVNNTVMTFLSLRKTEMNGTLPQMHNLRVLKHLDLSENQFEGTIHTEFGTLTHLNYLSLAHNEKLTIGQIPSELEQLTSLQELSLRKTKRIHVIPPRLVGKLVNMTLLDLGGNDLNKGIPTQMASLQHLRYLLLDGNLLTGGVDPILHSMGLEVLLVDNNDLEFTYNCTHKPRHLVIYADCPTNGIAGNSSVVCRDCCKCCSLGHSKTTECSRGMSTMVAKYENSFSRTINDSRKAPTPGSVP